MIKRTFVIPVTLSIAGTCGWFILKMPKGRSPWAIGSGQYSALDGSAFVVLKKGTPPATFTILDLVPAVTERRVIAWNRETSHVPVPNGYKTNTWNVVGEGQGFWHVGPENINVITNAIDFGRFTRGAEVGSSATGRRLEPAAQTKATEVHPNYSFILFFKCSRGGAMFNDRWAECGPIPGALYQPLKNLLSDCVLIADPDAPTVKPELDVPVITGKDSQGKDIIVMKPLITNFLWQFPKNYPGKF